MKASGPGVSDHIRSLDKVYKFNVHLMRTMFNNKLVNTILHNSAL